MPFSLLEFSASDLALVMVLLAAAGIDLQRRKIPNLLVLAALLMALVLALNQRGTDGLFFALEGAGAGLAILFPFFALGVLGAGDVKLLAAVGAFAGAVSVVSIAMLTFMLGGLLAVLFMFRLHGVRKMLMAIRLAIMTRSLSPLSVAQVRLPYACAMLCGTLAWIGIR